MLVVTAAGEVYFEVVLETGRGTVVVLEMELELDQLFQPWLLDDGPGAGVPEVDEVEMEDVDEDEEDDEDVVEMMVVDEELEDEPQEAPAWTENCVESGWMY